MNILPYLLVPQNTFLFTNIITTVYRILLLLLLLLYSFLNMFFFGPMFTRGWGKCWGLYMSFRFSAGSTCFGLLCFFFARNNVLRRLPFFGRIYVEGCLGMSHLSTFITSTLETITNGWNQQKALEVWKMMFRLRLFQITKTTHGTLKHSKKWVVWSC